MRTIVKKIFLTRLFLRKRLGKWVRIFDNAGWTWTRGLVVIGLSVGIVLMVIDIYVAVDHAIKNYKLLAIEERKLQETKALGRDLDEQLGYYSSLEYKQRYAYDSLNLAREGEALYTIDTGPRQEYSLERPNHDPIKKQDASVWWDVILDVVRE